MFFRIMKDKAWSEGFRAGYRASIKDAIIMSGDPNSQEKLDRKEGEWALQDARRRGESLYE